MQHLPAPERFIPNKDLEMGQTPFDNLTREELLRMVQAYHSTMTTTIWLVQLLQSATDPEGPFWKPGRSGYAADTKIETLRALTGHTADGGHSASHAFFRYADDLLFPEMAGEKWFVYPDGMMLKSSECRPGGRPLTWADLNLLASPPEAPIPPVIANDRHSPFYNPLKDPNSLYTSHKQEIAQLRDPHDSTIND